MPAYDDNPWSSLFFVSFIVVCMYIFVNIFLAVVYKNYRNHMEVGVLRFMLSALEVSFLYNMIFYIRSQVIPTFWLVLAYDLLEDRCPIDVIATKFFLSVF